MATAKTQRSTPALASGQTPIPGDRVVTFDGHRAEVLWTTPKLIRDHRKDPPRAGP